MVNLVLPKSIISLRLFYVDFQGILFIIFNVFFEIVYLLLSQLFEPKLIYLMIYENIFYA
jgi:hypothetical protein